MAKLTARDVQAIYSRNGFPISERMAEESVNRLSWYTPEEIASAGGEEALVGIWARSDAYEAGAETFFARRDEERMYGSD